MTKTCGVCAETKPVTEFYRRGGANARGWRSHCKTCHTARTLIRRDPVAHAAAQLRWYHADKSGCGSNRKAVLRNYSLTPDDWDRMDEAQGHVCAACGGEPTDPWWTVDHDHRCCDGPYSCGLCVRGLVHRQCNSAMGYVKDDPARLMAMAEYLEGHARSSY